MLGLDAARQGYWTAYGGAPGWAWLLDGFAALMRERGLGDAEQRILFVEAPGAAYTFGKRAHLRASVDARPRPTRDGGTRP